MVNRHILRHRKDKCRFTHRRTGSDNNQVGVLPTGSNLIQRIESGTCTAQTFLLVCRLLQQLHRVLDNRVDLGNVFLYITLGDFKQFPFGFLHQVFHIDRLVERLSLDHGGKGDQLSRQVFLCYNTGMVFDMRATGHFTGQLRDIERAAYQIEFATFP